MTDKERALEAAYEGFLAAVHASVAARAAAARAACDKAWDEYLAAKKAIEAEYTKENKKC